MPASASSPFASAKCIGLVGPYSSGKTTLFESILRKTSATKYTSKTQKHQRIGDRSPEATTMGMSTEVNIASADYLGETFTFLDCPGHFELSYEGSSALTACDVAIIVIEPDEKKIPALQVIKKELEIRGIPHFLFINKIDQQPVHIRALLEMLQPVSDIPLVLRQLPIRSRNDIITGFVDLALERAYIFEEHAPSRIETIPTDLTDIEKEARFAFLEKLSDHDDELLEMLLEDVEPAREKIFADLSLEVRQGAICPVFLGSAEKEQGLNRLLKAIRHDAPSCAETAESLETLDRTQCAQIIKTLYSPHGKLSISRILSGTFTDNMTVTGMKDRAEKISGIYELTGQETRKRTKALPGETIALAKLDHFTTGTTLSVTTPNPQIEQSPPPQPVFGMAITTRKKADEVKLSVALGKLVEEMNSLSVEHNQDIGEQVLWGMGPTHLEIARQKLKNKFGIETEFIPRTIGYRETITVESETHSRLKKQSGGHGQFADVTLDIMPLPRGQGFVFSDTISGGAVPKNYIPAVEHGVRDALQEGPLGFHVVDLAVNLKDGGFHPVDSCEQAFRIAGRMATLEGLAKSKPVLLEPIVNIYVTCPHFSTTKISNMIASHCGQILGLDMRQGWHEWDVIHARIAEKQLADLLTHIRSVTAGVGSFEYSADVLQEITGTDADHIIKSKKATHMV